MDVAELEETFKQQILNCYENKDWRELLDLNPHSNNKIAYKFLWVWPSIDNLDFIARKLRQFHRIGIISIGCGCGLFEWILQQFLDTEFSVIGYEVNESWWKSRYSNPLFINHHYPSSPIDSSELMSDHILLFCYFNNEEAFREYVDNFNGNVIIIIGPGDGRGTHTNPEPFRPKFGKIQYELHSYQEVKDTKDFIAVGMMYAYHFDKNGQLLGSKLIHDDKCLVAHQSAVKAQMIRRQPIAWLRFIVLFWSPRILKAAVKFGLAAMIMNKYERIGFAIMMLCFAF